MAQTLTTADIEAIVTAIENKKSDHCRYDVDPNDIKEAIAFFRAFRDAVADSKKTARRWIIVALMTTISLLIGLGTMSKIKESLP